MKAFAKFTIKQCFCWYAAAVLLSLLTVCSNPSGGGTSPVLTPDPAASVTAVFKTAETQKAVAFTLTTSHTGTWKVYDLETGGSVSATVTAAFDAETTTLTLTAAGEDLQAKRYYVSVTQAGSLESGRLELTVRAYTPPADLSPAPVAQETDTTVVKTSTTQSSVQFNLTSNHSEGVWKVYGDTESVDALEDVIASYNSDNKTLTLTAAEGNDLPAGTYYVTFTESPKPESARLGLTVGEFVAENQTPTPTIDPSKASVAKVTASQTYVEFELTTAPAGTWKVYGERTGGEALTAVSASLADRKLTLTTTDTAGLAAGTYWVSVTEEGKTESHRLSLTIAGARTATPTVAVASIEKASGVVKSVNFTVTATISAEAEWKVYDSADAPQASSTVTVTFDSTTKALTLTHGTDLPVGTYHVTLTEPGQTESLRLVLTIAAQGQSPMPAIDPVKASVAKTATTQKSVVFELTSPPAGTWKVYGAQTGGTTLTAVSASLADGKLTLTTTETTGLAAKTYYVSLTVSGKTESGRLALTVVGAPTAVPTVASATILKPAAVSKSVDFSVTSAPTATAKWYVYDSATATKVSATVTATFNATAKTLKLEASGNDLPAATYHVTLTEAGETESPRLALTVQAYVDQNQSPTPATSNASVAKTTLSQASVTFTLTNDQDGTWKVYDSATATQVSATVTASYDSATKVLTLTHGTNLPVGTYHVSLTEADKKESNRLALTVTGAPTATPTVEAATVEKAAGVSSVAFKVTSAVSATAVWKVYDNATATQVSSTVSATFNSTTLTLTHGTDLPVKIYYVTLTEPGGWTESARLALTVAALGQSATPQAAVASVQKTALAQPSVTFTLSSTHAEGSEWKVYNGETVPSPMTTITAAYNTGTKVLTLTHSGTDLPALTYYVSVTETGKGESARLALTVENKPLPTQFTFAVNATGDAFVGTGNTGETVTASAGAGITYPEVNGLKVVNIGSGGIDLGAWAGAYLGETQWSMELYMKAPALSPKVDPLAFYATNKNQAGTMRIEAPANANWIFFGYWGGGSNWTRLYFPQPQANVWRHLTFVVDFPSLTIFENGVQIAQNTNFQVFDVEAFKSITNAELTGVSNTQYYQYVIHKRSLSPTADSALFGAAKSTIATLNKLATVTFDPNGGNWGSSTASVIADVIRPATTAVLPETPPEKSNHAFVGWYPAEDGTGVEFTAETPVSADTTVYAKWVDTSTSYSVVFDANGGVWANNTTGGTLSDGDTKLTVTKAFGYGATLAGNMPDTAKVSFNGCAFQSWILPSGEAFTGTSVITSETNTVYAVWEVSNPAVFLKLRHGFSSFSGGQFTPETGDSSNTKAEPKNTGWTRGSGTSTGSKTYYYYKTGDKKAMNASATYLDLGAGAGAILKAATRGYTISAYVKIEGNRSGNGSFIWTFAGGNNSPSEGVYFIANSTRVDHVTKISNSEKTFALDATGRGKVTTDWLHVAYTQKGKVGTDNAKLYIDGVQVKEGAMAYLPADFTSALAGFNTLGGPCFTGDNNLSQTMFTDFRIYDAALTAAQIAALAGDLADLKSVASWSVAGSYTVTFDTDFGTTGVTAPASVSVVDGGVVGSLPVPTRTGHIFEGWYTAAAGGTKFTSTTAVTAPITLYAQWSANSITVAGFSGTTVDNSASNLLDENLTTLWTTNRLNQFYLMDLSFRDNNGNLNNDPAGLNGYRHWITIDLGEVVNNISKLEYYPREGGNLNQLVKDCEIYTSQEVNLKINIQRAIDAGLAKKVGETPVGGWDVTSSTGWRPAIVFTQDGTISGTPTPVNARYIQMRVTGTTQGIGNTYHIAVGELRLYTSNGTETLLTYPAGTQAYGDSQNNDQVSMIPMQAIDGNTSTNWLSGYINTSSYFNTADFTALKDNLPADPHFDVGHWVTLDLGSTPGTYSGLKYHRQQNTSNVGNFSGVEIYASDNLINPAVTTNTTSGMSLVKTFTGLPLGRLGASTERWTLLDFGQSITKRYLHIRITGEVYSGPAGYGNGYNAGPNAGGEGEAKGSAQLGTPWGTAAAAEFTIVKPVN
ncbi:MAG: InlB B-repeat-containing protein [Treponema sp.]|jgi:uncharacterized repeat protein (TIGR02543 family)|nr:InlB B-repeat-containing protein [Treponema sp.]